MTYLFSPLLILLAVVLYGVLHSCLAAPSVKAYTQSWFGAPAERSYRLLYNIVALVTFLPILALPAALPDYSLYAIPFPWIIASLAGQALAVLALLAGLLQTGIWSFIGLRQLAMAELADEPALIVSGLYKFVRHPLYTAGLLFIWLTPVMTLNLLALNIGLTAYILVGARIEENKLLRLFGDSYRRYQEQTPMLLPRPIFFRPGKDYPL